jgi:hypothetical protein
MKSIMLLGFVLGLFATGCSSPKPVASLEGMGPRKPFDYSYNAVWRAAVDAAQRSELGVLTADRDSGFISASRGTNVENVGIWVRSLGPMRTQVEVVGRQPGPPEMWLNSLEDEIFRAMAANLTHEGVGAAGTGTQVLHGAVVVTPGPQERTTVVIPEPRSNTTVVVSETLSAIEVRRGIELRLAELRRQQREPEVALAREEDELRRAELRVEIDRLRAELRTQEQGLAELEREVK